MRRGEYTSLLSESMRVGEGEKREDNRVLICIEIVKDGSLVSLG